MNRHVQWAIAVLLAIAASRFTPAVEGEDKTDFRTLFAEEGVPKEAEPKPEKKKEEAK